jgi:hypothetical protein
MKSNYGEHVSNAEAIPVAVHAADVVTAAGIDLADYDGVGINLAVGIGGITFSGTNKIDIKVTECDELAGTYTAVPDSAIPEVTVATGGIIKTFDEAHAAAAQYNFTYKGSKRYIKVAADFSGTHGTGTPMAATVNRGLPHLLPTS